jgi:hypothetical protein
MYIGLRIFLSFTLIAAGCMLAGFVLWFGTKRYIERTKNARGVVLKIKTVPFESLETFAPVVRFETEDGRALSFTNPVSNYPSEFEVGEHVDVLYDPEDPHKARAVKKVSDLFLPAKMFRIAGTASMAVGFLVGLALMLTNTVLKAI